MPIYEYRCESCGHKLEALQKLSDALLTVCPACSRSALIKLVSAAGFQLKGTGWYVTDFKGSGARPAAKKEDAAGAGDSEKKGDGQSESKKEPVKADAEAKADTKSQTKSEATKPATVSSGSGSSES